MKGKIKRIICIILMAIMLLSTSSGVIAKEIKMRIFKTNRSNNVTYEWKAEGITYPYIEDYEVASIDGVTSSSYRSYSYFCLSGGTPLRDPGSNLGTYNSEKTWETCSDDIFNNNGYGYSNAQNRAAFNWLVLNMYSETDDEKTKEYMLNNLNSIIKVYNPDKNYDVRNLDPEFIEVIEQFVVWQFVNNSPNNNEYLGSVADVQQFYINGVQYINKHEETAYALYEALRSEAINQNNGILKDSYNKEYALKLTGNIQGVTKFNGEANTYTMGPMTLSTNPQISNLNVIKGIEDSLSVKTNNISYLDSSGRPLSINSKKDLIGKTYFVKFQTPSPLSNDKTVTYKCMADFGYRLDTLTAKVYENTNVVKQPILQLKKSIKPNKSIVSISAKTDKPFDIALTKQILKVDRYNTNTNQYEMVANLNRLKNIDNSLIETRGTAAYIMDKRPINVQIGDKITYRIIAYNEGSQVGKVVNITDYLPTGLKLLKDETNERNKALRIQLGDSVNESQKNITFAVNLDCRTQMVVDVVCQVTDEAKIGENLLNYAAVTSYKDETGKYATSEGIDRDSEMNDSNRSDYEAHYQSVVNNNFLKEIIDGGQIDKTFLNIQDDDDYEVVRVGEFDLALRKFITTVKSSNGTTRTIENRVPKFDLYSSIALVSKGTALYHHEKDTIDVNIGDNVVYTLRVYNEGFQNGYAKEITDYLPAGLELVPYTAGDGSINAKYGWTQTKNSDGTSIIKTTAAANTVIEAGMSVNDLGGISAAVAEAYLPSKDPTGSDVKAKFYTDVQVECRVTGEASGVLVNVAEISNYGYKNASGQYIEVNREGIDRDSVEDNVIKDIDRYSDLVIEPQFDLGLSHFVGLEDDDDFESIKVPEKEITGQFNLELIKYIQGTATPLSNAQFKISIKDEQGTELVDQSKSYITGSDGKLRQKIKNLKISGEGKTYTVKIEEIATPSGYIGLSAPIVIGNVRSIKQGDVYVLVPQTPTIQNTKKVEVTSNEILVELENRKITGSFGLNLVKYIQGTTNPLAGAGFRISIKDEQNRELADTSKTYVTGSDGKLTEQITGLQIDGEGKTYTIRIEEVQVPEGYVGISAPITIQNVKSIKKGYEYVLETKTPKITNTKKVEIKDKEILVELENRKVTGSFGLNLIKYKNGTTEPLAGAGFRISIKDEENRELANTSKTYLTGTDGKLTEPITGLQILKENKLYTIKIEEVQVPEGYIGLSGPIIIENVKSIKSGASYILEAGDKTVQNSKKVTVSADEIFIEAENTPIPGQYSLQIFKAKQNGDTDTKLSGATFRIAKGASYYSKTTDSNGYTKAISNQITASNLNNADVWTITELATLKDEIIKIKNPLQLTVTKRLNSAGNKYIIDKIKLSEQNTSNSTEEVAMDERNGGNITLSGVQLLDGRTVDITARVASGNLIVVKVRNKEMTGKFSLRIKKVNSVTNEAINGVTFRGRDDNARLFEKVTANDGGQNGIAKIVEDKEITGNNQTFTYLIKELNLPASQTGKLLPITDFELSVKVTTKMNSAKTAYEVDTVKVTPIQKSVSETTEAQRRAIEKTEFNIENNEITITIYNEPTVDYNFKIKKVDMQGQGITGAKFTIYENDQKIIDNQLLGDLGEYLINRTNKAINTTYQYKIYETEPAQGYQNIFTKTYIMVDIVVDEAGQITADSRILPNYAAEATVFDSVSVQRKITAYNNSNSNKFLQNNGNNSYTLNIPNPPATTSINLTLNKHELNGTETVAGAVFSVKRIHAPQTSTANLTDLVSRFDANTNVESLSNITTSKNTPNIQIDSINSVTVGDSYFYQLTEETVPSGYQRTFKKAIIRVFVNPDKTVTANILAIKQNDSSDWVAYTNTYQNEISLNNEGNNNIKINWANKLTYVLKLFKKGYTGNIPRNPDGSIMWTGLQGISGTTLSVKQVSPVVQTIYPESAFSGSYVIVNDNANSNSTYHYEIIEHESAADYTNIFKDVKIHLYVTTKEDGSIDKANTYCNFEAINGTLSSQKIKYLKDKLGIVFEDTNTIAFYIANEKKTFNLSLMKVGSALLNDNLEGIPGVEFSIQQNGTFVYDNGHNPVTDNDGYIYLSEIPLGVNYSFIITETDVPQGITLLEDTSIKVEVDTTGITDPTQITSDMIHVTVVKTGANGKTEIEGLTAEMNEGTLVLTIPNTPTTYSISMLKTDEIGNPINNADGIESAKFTVSKNNEIIFNGELTQGMYSHYGIAEANTEYIYRFEEIKSKAGYINILEGWYLDVHISFGANAIMNPTNGGTAGNTYYELIQKDASITPKYQRDDVINKIALTTNIDESSGNGRVSLSIKNPYEYKLRLTKKDKSGNLNNKATIVAEKVNNAQVEQLSSANETTRKTILSNIANSDNTENRVCLDKKYVQISAPIEIKNNIGLTPKNNTAHVWRITETDVDKPYINILGDNCIIVQTIYTQNELKIVKHNEQQDGGTIVEAGFYVCNTAGDNLTKEYLDKVEVSISESNNEYKLEVSIKNPAKFYIDLNKAEYIPDPTGDTVLTKADMVPLAGAELTISSRYGDGDITGGETKSEAIGCEVVEGQVVSFTIEESSSAANHRNILKGKELTVLAKLDSDGTIEIVRSILTNKTPSYEITGDAKEEVLKYVKYFQEANSEGYPILHVYIENPIEFKFKLNKQDAAGQPLNGTEIQVNSSRSGAHYLNGSTGLEFTEENLKPGDIITYQVKELHTVEDSAYVNNFSNTMIFVVNINNQGEANLFSAFMMKAGQGSVPVQVQLSNVDFVDYNMSAANSDGVKTLSVILQNPTKINIELQKKQAGAEAGVIPNTKFKIVSSFSSNHTAQTDSNGKIKFTENNIVPGDYTYVVFETETAGENYVNVLKGVYMKINITVSASGEITINSVNYYACPGEDDGNYDNDIQITNSGRLDVLRTYAYAEKVVEEDNPVQKLQITVINPVTFNLNLYKEDIEGTAIPGAHFEITRTEVNTSEQKEINDSTNYAGEINLDQGWVIPGVYKFEVTETRTSGKPYINILEDCKLIIYVKVAENGRTSLVSNINGDEFSWYDVYRYDIEKLDGTEVDRQTEKIIHKYIRLADPEASTQNDINLTVINPVETKLDIIKKDQRGQNLSGTRFTVIRDDNVRVLANVDVTTITELTEQYLDEGEHIYYIREDSTKDGYINLLAGKYIKVYTELKGNGVLKIKDQDYNNSEHYFEIYEGDINDLNNSTLIDKNENPDLYNAVSVEAVPIDNIYTLNVTVMNPDITYNLVLNKKIFGAQGINLPETIFSIRSEFSGVHPAIFTDENGNITLTEERVPAGIYKYFITELHSAGNQFVNVLNNYQYIVVNLKVNEDGTIQIVDEDGNNADNTFYIYKKREDSLILDKLNLDDIVTDEFVRVETSMVDKTPQLDIYIKNPEYYNFKLIKKDKDTNQAMNGVEFTLDVYNQDDDKVELKDAETLEKLVNGKLVTHNENGTDGVISIPKILIEKTGTYTFVLHEESTDGIFNVLYKSLASDIRIEVEIVVENGEYVVKTPEVMQGDKYVELVSTSDEKAQNTEATLLNERIKGSYDLVINKLDAFTNSPLDGAEFDITVEKNEAEYELHSVTEDVTENEVIIPTHVTIDGELTIPNIRIERPETYTIILTETKAPEGHILLPQPIKVEVTTIRSGSNDDEKFIVQSAKIISGDNYGLVKVNNNDEIITLDVKNGYFDLALRKYIVAVDDKELLDTDQNVSNKKYQRQPTVDISKLKDGTNTTAEYTHTKEPVEVCINNIVTYTLEVFNEGNVPGYASLIKDDIPEGLEFVTYTPGDGSTNDIYRWKMVDENDNEVTDPKQAVYVVSDYLSKENEKEEHANLINEFNPETMDKLDSKYVKVAFKVVCKEKSTKIITNQAQISKETDESGKDIEDRDSTPNVWKDEDDEDIENIKVLYFDLALRKWVTKAFVTENGKTVVMETGHHAEDDPEDIVKVDLKKSKLQSVDIKFEYSIRVTNEGVIPGYATEIKDRIPNGLKFDSADNPNWHEIEDGIIVTDQLKDRLLNPGESAEVVVVLTWVKSRQNMGLKVNVAEISKDQNDRGAPDIDSVPDNNVPGEDDIDDAPVMLSIKTGSAYVIYIIIAVTTVGIIAGGVVVIKRRIVEK